jgi:phenylpropionate dioxygenase-like ring-hydroxylating dioxygenase large terminal subunit
MNASHIPLSNAAEPHAELPRGDRIAEQNRENGYFQCWYPMALSTEVAAGQVVSREFLNGRVIVFRGQNGEPAVMSAFCRHLGADLALGTVIGNEVRCVYHHWSYDQRGACVKIAAGDPPPAAARLFRFPTAERYGIIWAFNGTEPLYDVPDIGVPEDSLVLRAKEKEVLPVEPYVPFSNALDLQHLRVIHELEVVKSPDSLDTRGYSIEYDIEFIMPMMGRGQQRIKMFGCNTIIITQQFMARTVHMGSFGRILPGGRTAMYNFMATPKSQGRPGEDQMVQSVLSAAESFGDRLQDEDRGVMHSVSFRRDCLSASDRFLAAYLQFAQNFPRSKVACDMLALR